MSLKCYYHPDREATTKCEKCEKVICIKCKKSYNVTHGVKESLNATQHDMCKPCYYDIEIEKYTFSSRSYYIAFFIPVLMCLIPIFTALVFAFGLSLFFYFIIILMIMILFLRRMKSSPEKLAELMTKKEKFLKTLQSGNVCPECGNKVEIGISICPSCGSNLAG